MPSRHTAALLRRLAAGAVASIALLALSGCTVITIAGVATSAVVGAAKLTGAAIGTAVDLVVPDGEDEK
jgi:hypothetical protein